MKLTLLIASIVLTLSSQSLANTSALVYCGFPDGTDWSWLLDENGNDATIEGLWGEAIDTFGRNFKVFKVHEFVFNEKALRCPEEGYVTQPTESGGSSWDVFKIIRPDGSSYIIDAHKSYYNFDELQQLQQLYFQRM